MRHPRPLITQQQRTAQAAYGFPGIPPSATVHASPVSDTEEENTFMVSAADDIIEMITARSSHTGGTLELSDSLENLGLDSMEVVSLIFDIEEKFNIQIPINANMDIESKTLADLIQAVDQLVAAKVKSN
jgi:acyl carrier protein